MITRQELEASWEVNALTSYRDAQAVYVAKRGFKGEDHEHYWSFWRACGGFQEGINCYICGKPWEGCNGS